MRSSLAFAAALASLPVGAIAQDYETDAALSGRVGDDALPGQADAMASDMRHAADRLEDPATQAALANAFGAMAESLMAMPIGDLAGGDARSFANEARDQARTASNAMGVTARAMADAMPALVEALGHLRGAMEGMEAALPSPPVVRH